jgi:hypothetical protein
MEAGAEVLVADGEEQETMLAKVGTSTTKGLVPEEEAVTVTGGGASGSSDWRGAEDSDTLGVAGESEGAGGEWDDMSVSSRESMMEADVPEPEPRDLVHVTGPA